MSSNNTALYVGAGLVGVYLLTRGGSTAAASNPVTSLLSSVLPSSTPPNVIPTGPNAGTTYPYLTAGAPAIPPAFSQAYINSYILPAMIAVNSNVSNPGYTLSQTDATNYMANYTDVAQWANNTGPQGGARHQTPYQAAVYHWHTYGVPQARTFMPLPWNDPGAWVPAVQNPNSSGSSSTMSVIGDVASVALAVLGPNNQDDPVLNDTEIQCVVTGAAVAKALLPMFKTADPVLVQKIDNKINSVIMQYN